jgi:hypothetical protein
MSVTAFQIVSREHSDVNGFNTAVADAIADNWQPLGAPFFNAGHICLGMIKGAVDSNTGLTPAIVPAAAVADSVAEDIETMVVDHNALLASLRASGALLP